MSDRKAVVYMVEDDPSFRKSMERLIRASGFEVLSFKCAPDFLAQSRLQRPACLLLDVQLPGMDGLRLQEKLLETECRLPVIFMTGHGNIPMSVQAMKKGAVDFLPKPFEAKDLRNAILKAVECDTHAFKKEVREGKVRSLVNTLTPREKEVMRWVITGKLNKQIAPALGVTEKTVKVHRSRVMQKTKVSSVAELVRLAEAANIPPAV
jgi:two-component system, LuxR family, response regulator FixJ